MSLVDQLNFVAIRVTIRGLIEELRKIPGLELVLFSDRPILEDYFSVVGGLERLVFGFSRRRHWANWLLAAKLKSCRIDVYHAIWDAGVPFFAPCPSILTLHSITPFQRPPHATVDMIRNPVKRFRYRLTFEIERRISRRIIVTSQYMLEYIHRHAGVPRQDMDAVYLGVDREFQPIADEGRRLAVARKYGLAGRRFFLSVPSRVMEERKNVPLLVRGYQLFLARVQPVDLPLVVVGEFPADRAAAEQKIFDGVGDAVRRQVIFLGHVPRAELAVLLNICEALVYPSFYEGFGLPLVEAFACGAPVLSANTSCIPEVAGNAALLVDPFKAEELAEAMVNLYSRADLRASLRERGLQRAALFSWKQHAAEVCVMYRRLCVQK